MTNITRRKLIQVGGAVVVLGGALTIPSSHSTAALERTTQRFRDEALVHAYLAWLDQERLDVAQALGAVGPDGQVHVREINGLFEIPEEDKNDYNLDKRARLYLLVRNAIEKW